MFAFNYSGVRRQSQNVLLQQKKNSKMVDILIQLYYNRNCKNCPPENIIFLASLCKPWCYISIFHNDLFSESMLFMTRRKFDKARQCSCYYYFFHNNGFHHPKIRLKIFISHGSFFIIFWAKVIFLLYTLEGLVW